jgi:hypothetical protein
MVRHRAFFTSASFRHCGPEAPDVSRRKACGRTSDCLDLTTREVYREAKAYRDFGSACPAGTASCGRDAMLGVSTSVIAAAGVDRYCRDGLIALR